MQCLKLEYVTFCVCFKKKQQQRYKEDTRIQIKPIGSCNILLHFPVATRNILMRHNYLLVHQKNDLLGNYAFYLAMAKMWPLVSAK